jgi:hypothetical protein
MDQPATATSAETEAGQIEPTLQSNSSGVVRAEGLQRKAKGKIVLKVT